ncbi:hypothetical protein QEZ54_12315 [Catellatospora sp. KI3]|uniref:hypothetical protein n=1 Tax=Catellatospora sp. KI3 TaxID=3041620 RepID=UPI002482981B|nr:hypothetical protein [Catellatospora sp. KI3]MDI1461759.1 hypothetical protein [Catellatospora sp. KI3]
MSTAAPTPEQPANPVPPAHPAHVHPSRVRPLVVQIAAAILALLGLLALATGIIQLAAIPGVINRFKVRAAVEGVSGQNVLSLSNGIKGTLIGTALLYFIVALVLFALAWGVWQGNRVARILTWVVCGLGIIVACCSLSSAASLGTNNVTLQGGDPEMAQAAQSLLKSFPAWWAGLTGVSSVAQALGYIATAVLLALPAANVFFNRDRPATLPPAATPPPVSPPTNA